MANSEDIVEVGPVDVVTPPAQVKGTSIHPYSGVLTIAVDQAFWGVTAATLGTAALLAMFLSFACVALGVFLVQKNIAGEPNGRALARGVTFGTLAGIPTPVAGTAVGALVLAWAGFKHVRR